MTNALRHLPFRRMVRTFWADESGANLVEFSLVITLFLFLLLEIGRAHV